MRTTQWEPVNATWEHSHNDGKRLNQTGLGAMTVRYRLGGGLEAQIGWAGMLPSSHLDDASKAKTHITQPGDLTLSTQYNLTGQNARLLKKSVQSCEVPVRSDRLPLQTCAPEPDWHSGTQGHPAFQRREPSIPKQQTGNSPRLRPSNRHG